jgi:alkylation response protein AidB-like acyl-CoA dehydrogenase
MRFGPDEAAHVLREATADVLRGYQLGTDPAPTWDKLADVGVLGTLVPEEHGGLGLDENALVPVLEEIGYSGLPGPAAETIAVAAPLLRETQGLVAVRAGDGELIPYGLEAPRTFIDMVIYQRDELTLAACPAVDPLRPLARVTGELPAGARVDGDADATWQRGVLGTAALLCGLARRMLDMTVEYVKRREQYGVPVGSFQAVKHALANAHVAVEFARPAVLAAAWAQSMQAQSIQAEAEHEPGADSQTSAAKILASDAARLAARTAIQCHGAMGYTTEYDLHLFAKRAWALAPSWGGADWHRARIAGFLGV